MLHDLSEIKKRRKRLDMTQSALAGKAGVSQSLIAKLEAGKIDPAYSKIKSITDVLEAAERGSSIRAKDIMSRRVVSVEKGAKLYQAIRLMRHHNISQMPVIHRGHVIGTATEKSVLDLIAGSDDPSRLSTVTVGQVMEEPLPRVGQNTPVLTISVLLKDHTGVLIVERENVIGMVTKADMMKMIR
ncbi:MAG: CBS domain-containing protein [Candidatus Aenigmarchaeota archaeon]|nr:CBS domain-containing protein [Candidatus Aenigmarchaeota archaeon]